MTEKTATMKVSGKDFECLIKSIDKARKKLKKMASVAGIYYIAPTRKNPRFTAKIIYLKK